MNILTIDYNPYTNKFNFTNKDGSENKNFSGLTTREHALTHRIDDIIAILKDCKIKKVDCIMVKTDYELLKRKLELSVNGIEVNLKKEYSESKETIQAIKKYYDKIRKSYDGYYEIIDVSGDDRIKAIQTHKKEIEELIKSYNDVVSDIVKLAFVSRYSSGKSYLINSIIGKAMFEEDPGTTTQFIHELSYSEKISLEYEYLDGTRKKFDIGSFGDLTDNLSKLTNVNCPVAKGLKIVHIEYPFETSILNIKGRYKILFYDTPGPSANGYDTEKLLDFFKEQKDTLPIFVLNENTIEESANKKIFKNMGADNFATAFRFVFFNKCDKLDNDTLPYLDPNHRKSLIDDINTGFSNPTIVCGSAKWYLQEKCNTLSNHPDKNKYDNLQKFEVYKFNQIFEGEKLEDCCGVATLEDQINTYIINHAEYQKCQKAKTYLLNICELSTALYENLEAEEEKRKKEKIKSFEEEIDKRQLSAQNDVAYNICEIQIKKIKDTIDEMDKELKTFYNVLSKKERASQQKCKKDIVERFEKQLNKCVSGNKDRLISEAIEKLDEILEIIEKDESIPVEKRENIRSLFSESNKHIKSLSNSNNANLFRDTIALKPSAIHKMKQLLHKDKKSGVFKGELESEIQKSIEEFYKELNGLYKECKKNIKDELNDISLIIKGITQEIEKIEDYNRVIEDTESNLELCFFK